MDRFLILCQTVFALFSVWGPTHCCCVGPSSHIPDVLHSHSSTGGFAGSASYFWDRELRELVFLSAVVCRRLYSTVLLISPPNFGPHQTRWMSVLYILLHFVGPFRPSYPYYDNQFGTERFLDPFCLRSRSHKCLAWSFAFPWFMCEHHWKPLILDRLHSLRVLPSRSECTLPV